MPDVILMSTITRHKIPSVDPIGWFMFAAPPVDLIARPNDVLMAKVEPAIVQSDVVLNPPFLTAFCSVGHTSISI